MKIGLFDSGVGGLSVLKALEKELPHQEYLYFADQKHFPYGNKQPHEILHYAQSIATFLISQDIDLLIIACNTATVFSLDKLREQFDIPILGMINPAIQAINKHACVISILATDRTIQSNIYRKEIEKRFPKATILPIACPNLAPLIEENKEVDTLLEEHLLPLHDQNVDTLLLGCTHYAFAEKSLKKILEKKTEIIDPAKAVAKRVAEQFRESPNSKHHAKHTFYVSGDLTNFSKFLQKHLPNVNFEMHFFQ